MYKRCCIPLVVEDYVPMYYDAPPVLAPTSSTYSTSSSPRSFAPAAQTPDSDAPEVNTPGALSSSSGLGGDQVDDRLEEECDEDCESSASREELLRKEALLLDHLLTHTPKNPFCK